MIVTADMERPRLLLSRALLLSVALLLLLFCASVRANAAVRRTVNGDPAPKLVYFPIDERFATRGMFLNLAAATPFDVVSPPPELICSLKQPADTDRLAQWLEQNLPNASVAVISIEMALYGGLIASRISNDTTLAVLDRLQRLTTTIQRLAPGALVYFTTVVMRIPSYNGDFEEPWYWANYGRDLYLYSYYTDQATRFGNSTAQALANAVAALVPASALKEFVWRRQRNFDVTMALLKLGVGASGGFSFLCVTLDDNAPFGANIAEAVRLAQAAHDLGLDARVNFHPGADEVGLVMLARAAAAHQRRRVRVAVLWRLPAPADVNRIPNYEGQPLNTSMYAQLAAAGVNADAGDVVAYAPQLTCARDFDMLLVMNNFDELPAQVEAKAQNFSLPISQYDALRAPVVAAAAKGRCEVALADVRYSNGADAPFVAWMLGFSAADELPGSVTAYAGWNTAGNSLGTAIANGVLSALYATVGATDSQPRPQKQQLLQPRTPDPAVVAAATQFTILRILEDYAYQSIQRQRLTAYVVARGDSPTDLRPHLDEYEQFVYTPVHELSAFLCIHFRLSSFQLDAVFFPWNRTFEVGFDSSLSSMLLDAADGTATKHTAAPSALAAGPSNQSDGTLVATDIACDIAIVGGSTAALAAALAAAREDLAATGGKLRVCLFEPTDWPGGQLSAEGVSAIDSTARMRAPANQAADFTSLLHALAPGGTDAGDCWVSTVCYVPSAVQRWLAAVLPSLPNLAVYTSTVLSSLELSAATGTIASLTLVQRAARVGVDAWDRHFSDEVDDWYAPADSPRFAKTILTAAASVAGRTMVVIDATAFGDVLVLADAPYTVGPETPDEFGPDTLETCGQCTTFPFLMRMHTTAQPPEPLPVYKGRPFSLSNHTWAQIWSYRRVSAANVREGIQVVAAGDVSNQNWLGGNDMCSAYGLLGRADARRQASVRGAWRGGLRTRAFAAAEARAYGWFQFLQRSAAPAFAQNLSLVRDADEAAIGTRLGLTKAPYVRDSRRAVGIDGFRLFYANMSAPAAPGGVTAAHFPDAVGIGEYFYADVHRLDADVCTVPAYLTGSRPVVPFYLPFRALTVGARPNLLVAGKTMAQSFQAAAATRVHPVELASGAAAGVGAALMAAEQWSSADALREVARVRERVARQAPVEWTQ